jgi:hypothetical protein
MAIFWRAAPLVVYATVLAASLILLPPAFAGEWRFDEAEDLTEDRRGSIVYSSDNFTETSDRIAKFIVTTFTGTAKFHLRAAYGQNMVVDKLDIDIRTKRDGEYQFFTFYKAQSEWPVSQCVGESNLAANCQLQCARTAEDLHRGNFVSCSTKVDGSLWIDFRADFKSDHLEYLLENYADMDAINIYAGQDTNWSIDAANLIELLCNHTQPYDHPCRGGAEAASESVSDTPEDDSPTEEQFAALTKPLCLFTESLGDFSVTARAPGGWEVLLNTRDGSQRLHFRLDGDYKGARPGLALVIKEKLQFEGSEELELTYETKEYRHTVHTTYVDLEGFQIFDSVPDDVVGSISFNGMGGDEDLETEIDRIEEVDIVTFTLTSKSSGGVEVLEDFSFSGLSLARALAENRAEDLEADRESGECRALPGDDDDDDDWWWDD